MIWEEGKYYAVMKAVNLRNLPEGFPVGRLEEEARRFFQEPAGIFGNRMGTGRGQIRILAAHPPESGPFFHIWRIVWTKQPAF